MDNQFTYKLLHNLPRPPKSLISLVDFDMRPEINNIATMGRRELIDWKGYNGPALRNTRRIEQPFQNDFDQWIKENITKDYQNSSLMYCPENNNSPSTGAHTDFTRDYVLMYNLNTGGEDAELCFYQEKNQPLVRDRGTQAGEYKNLELIDSVKGPKDSWYLINARILHSVENIKKLRLNLQISFDNILPQNLI